MERLGKRLCCSVAAPTMLRLALRCEATAKASSVLVCASLLALAFCFETMGCAKQDCALQPSLCRHGQGSAPACSFVCRLCVRPSGGHGFGSTQKCGAALRRHPQQADEMADAVAVLQQLSEESATLLAKIEAACGR